MNWSSAWKRLCRWLRNLFRNRYREWLEAELSGSKKLKDALDQSNLKLWLSGRCVFCGLPFDHGEQVVWLPAHRRGYCLDCRDKIIAEERDEADREAKAGPYAVRGMSKKDFYR